MKKLSLVLACVGILSTATFATNSFAKDQTGTTTTTTKSDSKTEKAPKKKHAAKAKGDKKADKKADKTATAAPAPKK